MQKVIAFKAIDGKVFGTKEEAENHDFNVQLRAMFATITGGKLQCCIAPFCRGVTANLDTFVEFLSKRNMSLKARAKKQKELVDGIREKI